jgi:tight adherence protein B
VRSTPFPYRAYVLDLPTARRLGGSLVEVTENGAPVEGVSVVPATAAGRGQFGTVLAIDASQSMTGRPIVAAIAAARAFAAHRTPNQQLAVVTFNSAAHVVLPFTTDPRSIHNALAKTPRLAFGTHIYDGISAGLDLLRTANIRSGSIVVLSDGADTGSAATEAAVARDANAAGVRIFTVGLRSGEFDRRTLERIAADAHGRYSEARSSAALARIYDELGAQLANEYLIRYRSLGTPATRIAVRVTVRDVGSVGSAYVTPALSKHPGAPFHRSFAQRFWGSPVAVVFTSLLVAGLVWFVLVALLRPRNPDLRKRMAEFVSVAPQTESGAGRGSVFSGKVFAGTEKGLEQLRWWSQFKADLELAQIKTPPVHIVVATALATLFAMWLFASVGGASVLAVLGLVVPLFVRGLVRRRVDRHRRLFSEQLPDNLQVLSSALRAGHSLVGALSVVVDDSPEPSRSEFKRVIADEQLGVQLDEALITVAKRMQNPDLEQVALVAALQRQTGGNSAEVLDRVTETIRERFELRRMVKTLTAQGRMSRWVVTFLPVVLLLAITALNPHYLEPLLSHSAGRILLGFAAAMVVAGSLVIKRIVNIKV